MELTESIESINRQLIDLYGIDSISGRPIFRIVFSENEFEKRLTEYTDSGLKLLHPEVRLLPKYKQWIHNKYLLERLVIIPDINSHELPVDKLSYEPLWVFEDAKGNYLPPTVMAAKFCIDTVYAAMGKRSMAKYVDDEVKNENREERLNQLTEELFGDESNLLGRTITGEAVAYTGESKNTGQKEN